MPRQARIVLGGYPHHIIHRGHNRQNIFTAADDYRRYLDNLLEWKESLGCRLHAYCLMTNHVHLIIDPGDTPENLSRLMKRVAGRQTRYVNKLEKRTGTLWEGRFKSSPIETERYLLACCRYVELNPVMAGMVAAPADYPWSSYRQKIGLEEAHVDFDPLYLGFGPSESRRREVWRDFVLETLAEGEGRLIRDAVQRGQLTGGEKFVEEVARRIDHRIELRGQGRPKRLQK